LLWVDGLDGDRFSHEGGLRILGPDDFHSDGLTLGDRSVTRTARSEADGHDGKRADS
jgi:hypothetical protein